jgi:hypothetical protein
MAKQTSNRVLFLKGVYEVVYTACFYLMQGRHQRGLRNVCPAGDPLSADVQPHPSYQLLQLPNPGTGEAGLQASKQRWLCCKL